MNKLFARLMQPLRFIAVITLLTFYVTLSLLFALIFWNPWSLARYRSYLHSYVCRLGAIVSGVRVRIKGELPRDGSRLVVSNHLSYLDVLVLACRIPSCFVTSVEMKETPVLGHLTRSAGCLFVERRNKQNISEEILEITQALRHGTNVTIFPEATSTDGSELLRFRKPLYTASIDSGRATLPVCINYMSIAGEPVTVKNRDSIYWYGDMPFLSHMWGLMGLGRVDVELTILPSLDPVQEKDVTSLAAKSHDLVKGVYLPCVKPGRVELEDVAQ